MEIGQVIIEVITGAEVIALVALMAANITLDLSKNVAVYSYCVTTSSASSFNVALVPPLAVSSTRTQKSPSFELSIQVRSSIGSKIGIAATLNGQQPITVAFTLTFPVTGVTPSDVFLNANEL